ncbi:MAG: HPr family phosphocarrier protein [Verrucomicrobia bacterium]|nr:HPr family phosphocarrier protein [Verrucomicrobiota bacterium]MBU6446445.1 HPr family phosphocarrier protein [Verrucomicrobiota bacterium]MDE3047494.1 HPr family phosphocarrier protein [Verrucomicrobiota bacterium]
MRLTRKVKVKNALGLHTRPAATIVKLLQSRKSSVFFIHKNETINARSIMSILMLAAKKNAVIEVIVDGEDAEATMQHIVAAFEGEFGEK